MPEPITVYDLIGKSIHSEKRQLGFVVLEVKVHEGGWLVCSSNSRYYLDSIINDGFKLDGIPLDRILKIEK